MKFIKYAVGLVIALSVIPMVVVAVTKLDEPRLKTIEFEVLDYDSDTGVVTFSDNTFNDINSLAILEANEEFEGYFYVTNLITTTLNGIETTNVTLEYSNNAYNYDDNDNEIASLTNDNTAQTGTGATIGDKWTMTFDVSTEMPPLIKLLVGFAPLLLAGGVLLFMLNKRKLD